MKRNLITALSICIAMHGNGQQFLDHIKDKINKKVNDAIDSAASSKKTKKTPDSTAAASTTPKNDSLPAGKESKPEDFKAYSKFDFVPGEKIIVEENFSQDSIGEFPDKWNTKTNATVVTLSNQPGRWLEMKEDGIFFPEYIPELPDNFTLQVDIGSNKYASGLGSLYVVLAGVKKKDANETFYTGANGPVGVPGIKLVLSPHYSGDGQITYSTNALGRNTVSNHDEFHIPDKLFATLSVWRQRQRLRVYLNSTKILDLPRALEADAILNSLIFGALAPNYDKKGGAFYVSNIRLAVGAPDTRNKLITLGKFVTHGILFDVNSDLIKPQSYGALQDIANTLQTNPAVRVRIVGHTDSDGDDKANLDLSRRRADAVKANLVTNFGIDAARLETDGKGKNEPIDSNTTPEGKANNRRVEFIKL